MSRHTALYSLKTPARRLAPMLDATLFALLRATVLTIALATVLATAAPAAADEVERWLLVDTTALTVTVMDGDDPTRAFENIAIGSNGPTRTKLVGDETTPLGRYHITEIRDSQRFHIFMGIDYPTMADADRAMADGRIGDSDYRRIRRAWREGRVPPQNTPLGGHLGLHGLGRGDEEIHGLFNWTNGCIALTNAEIVELSGLLEVGTRVEVR